MSRLHILAWALLSNVLAVCVSTGALAQGPTRASGVLVHHPADVRSAEAWKGHIFTVDGVPLLPSDAVPEAVLLKYVGRRVAVIGRWYAGTVADPTVQILVGQAPVDTPGSPPATRGDGLIVDALQELTPDVATTMHAWRTYANAKYGYRISHPDEFELILTGLEHERDGRTFRIVRRNHAAPVPTLDVQLEPNAPLEPGTSVLGSSFDRTVTRMPIVLDGRNGTESVYRFKSSGEVASIVIDLGAVRFLFTASADTQDFRATPWWQVIQSFQLGR
ncbi:MAG: hypothetical protein U1F35_04515 [Steroidobacteraceae bacterium]